MFSFSSPICFLRQLPCPLPFFHSFYHSTKRGRYFLKKLVSLKRESSITNPKNAPSFSRANPNKNLPATLYIKFDFVSPQDWQWILDPYQIFPSLLTSSSSPHIASLQLLQEVTETCISMVNCLEGAGGLYT